MTTPIVTAKPTAAGDALAPRDALAEAFAAADAERDAERERDAYVRAQRTIIRTEYEIACLRAKADGAPPPAFASQIAKAEEILAAFADGVSLVTFVASPQWGKTGVIVYLTYALGGLPDDARVPPELSARPVDPSQVYVFTGMSDNDWVRQTRARMLPSFRGAVAHRNAIARTLAAGAADADGGLRDALIVLDECHCATESTQTLCATLSDAGLLDYAALRERNVRLVCVSATPAHVLMDAARWGGASHRTVIAKEADTYLSFADLVAEDRVRPRGALTQEAFVALVRERWGPGDPKYHIVRQINKPPPRPRADADVYVDEYGETRYADPDPDPEPDPLWFSAHALREAGFAVSKHDSASRLARVDEMLRAAPQRHHVILIKGFWRASKTFPDAHVGVCAESYRDHSAVLQGLGGRLLGHHKQRGDRAPLLFCDPEPIRAYSAWLDGDCDYRAYASYESRVLRVARGVVKKKRASTVHRDVVAGLPASDEGPSADGEAPPARWFAPLRYCDSAASGRARPPEAAFAATALTVYPTRAAFLSAVNVPLAPDEWPDRAIALTQLLTRAHREAAERGAPPAGLASVNASYSAQAARDVSGLQNYFRDDCKSWAHSEHYVIWCGGAAGASGASDEVIVIRKRLAELAAWLRAPAPGAPRLVVAHAHDKRERLYELRERARRPPIAPAAAAESGGI